MSLFANISTVPLQRAKLEAIAVLLSLVFSALIIVQNPALNDDAYSYLRAAALFHTDGAMAVFADHGWYGYSILIALMDTVLPGGLLIAAHTLNALLHSALVIAFIRCSNELHGGRHSIFAAMTILAFPLLNEMRYFLIRDFGFWTFMLLSLWQLLRYRAEKQWQSALAFTLALAAATIFRLEALLIAALAPMGLLGARMGRQLFTLYAMMAAVAVVVTMVCLILQLDLLALMGYAYRYYVPRALDLTGQLTATADALMQLLFTADNYPGRDNTFVGLIIVLFAYGFSVLANVVNALSIPVTVFLAHALSSGWLNQTPPWRGPLAAYSLAALVSLGAIIGLMHFVTQRYATLLCLLFLLQLPAVIGHWWERIERSSNPTRYRGVAAGLLFYFLIDSLFSFGHSRNHLAEAANWLRDELPVSTTKILTNSPYLAFSSGRVVRYDEARLSVDETLGRVEAGVPLALNLKAGNFRQLEPLEQEGRLALIQRFGNDRGDEVRIYQVH